MYFTENHGYSAKLVRELMNQERVVIDNHTPNVAATVIRITGVNVYRTLEAIKSDDNLIILNPIAPGFMGVLLIVTDRDGNKVQAESILSCIQKMPDADEVEGPIPPLMEHSPLKEIIGHDSSRFTKDLDSLFKDGDISVPRHIDERIYEDVEKIHGPGNIEVWAGPRIVPVPKHYRGEGKPLNPSSYGEEHEPEMFVLVSPQSTMRGNGGPVLFYLDSGASHHASGDESILSNLRDLPARRTVTLADGFRLDVTKFGDFQTPEIQIQDIHLIPGLEMNVISVRQLAKSKVVTTFYEKHAELFLGGEWIGGAVVDDTGLYRLSYLEAPSAGEIA